MNTRTLEHFELLQLIGPMSGIKEANRPAFHQVAKRLRADGYEVWSPAELDDTGKQWNELMQPCIRQIPQSDALVALHGWEDSIGATIEAMIGLVLKKPLLEPYNLDAIDTIPLRQKLAAVLPLHNSAPIQSPADEAQELLTRFQKAYKAALNVPPMIRQARDLPHMKDVVTSLGLDAATEMLHYFFDTWMDLDDFARENPIPGVFASSIPKMQQYQAGNTKQDDRPFSRVMEERGYAIVRRDGIPVRSRKCTGNPEHETILYERNDRCTWGCSECRTTIDEE